MDLLDRIYNTTGDNISSVTVNNLSNYANLLVMISYSKRNPASFDELKGICYLDVGTEIGAGGYRKSGTASGHIIRAYKVPVTGDSMTINFNGTDHYQIFGLKSTEDVRLIEAYVNDGTAVTSVSIDWSNKIIFFAGNSQFTGKTYEEDKQYTYISPTEITYSAYYRNTNTSSSVVLTSVSNGPTEFTGRWFGYLVIGIVKVRTEYERATSIFSSESQASGIVSASSWAGGAYLPWYAFDGQWGYDRQTWATTYNLPQWIQYKFTSPVCITRIITVNRNEDAGSVHNNRAVSNFTLQGSNDGSNWTNIQNCTIASSASHYKETIDIQNQNEYLYYRLYVTNNFNNATGTGCGFAEVEMYKTVNVYEYGGTAGDIKAIGDWFKGTRYSKSFVNSFFLYKNNFSPYVTTIVGLKNQNVRLYGRSSLQTYNLKLDKNGRFYGMLFFTSEETVDVSTDGGTTSNVITLPEEHKIIINLAKTVYIYKDGQIVNNAQIQIDSHTATSWHCDSSNPAVVNSNDKLSFNSWPNNTYFRESYIRTGISVATGDVLNFNFDVNVSPTAYDRPMEIDADGELELTFMQPIWDTQDYRNKYQAIAAKGCAQNSSHTSLFGTADEYVYDVYQYQASTGADMTLASFDEISVDISITPEIYTIYTAVIYGAPNETITIDYGSNVTETITLDSMGEATKIFYAASGDEIELTCSISGNTETVEFGSATEIDIYLRPYKFLYWYGLINTKLTGGFESIGTKTWSGSTPYPPSVVYNTNNIYLEQIMETTWQNRCGMLKTINNIDISNFTKAYYILDTDCYTYGGNQGMNAGLFLSVDDEVDSSEVSIVQQIALAENGNPRQVTRTDYHGSYTFSSAISALDNVYIGFNLNVNTGYCKTTLKAVWLE